MVDLDVCTWGEFSMTITWALHHRDEQGPVYNVHSDVNGVGLCSGVGGCHAGDHFTFTCALTAFPSLNTSSTAS